MSTVNIPLDLRRAMRTAQFMRNAKYPAALAHAFMREEANHLMYVRPKLVGRFRCAIAATPVGGAPERWRCYWHSGSFASQLWAAFECMRAGSDGGADDPFAKLLVELTDGTDVGTVEFHTTANPGSPSTIHPPSLWSTGRFPLRDSNGDIVTLTPNTDYIATFSDNGGSRMVGAVLWEKSKAADTTNGYLPDGPVTLSPIFDEDRGDMVSILRTAWKRDAAQLWNYASNTDATAPSRASASYANWLDQTVTSGSASSPGAVLKLANKSTVRRAISGVPVAWKIFANIAAGSGGSVRLVDSSNNVIDTIAVDNTTAQWLSGSSSLFLPASDSIKYELHFLSNGVQQTKIYASSLYQYET